MFCNSHWTYLGELEIKGLLGDDMQCEYVQCARVRPFLNPKALTVNPELSHNIEA